MKRWLSLAGAMVLIVIGVSMWVGNIRPTSLATLQRAYASPTLSSDKPDFTYIKETVDDIKIQIVGPPSAIITDVVRLDMEISGSRWQEETYPLDPPIGMLQQYIDGKATRAQATDALNRLSTLVDAIVEKYR